MKSLILLLAFSISLQSCSDDWRWLKNLPKPAGKIDFYQQAVWSPEGQRLLLSHYLDGAYRLELYDLRTKHLSVVSEYNDYWASWSPEGHQIVYHSKKTGNGELFVSVPGDTSSQNISNNPADDTSPAWAPNGDQIAFISDREEIPQLFLMSPDGTNIQIIESGGKEVYHPDWSPDGLFITFFMTREEEDWVATVQLETNTIRLLAKGTFPSWAPNGKSLLFDREHDLFTVSAFGSTESRIIPDAWAGRWSPDGKTILFIRGRWPVSKVMLADAMGQNIRPLLPSSPNNQLP